MLKDHNANGSGGQSDENLVYDMMKLLESHGVSDERLTKVVAQLGNSTAEATKGEIAMSAANGNGNGNGAHAIKEVPPLNDKLELSKNAEVILEKRYFVKDDDGKALEDAAGLFKRVSSAIAKGENSCPRPHRSGPHGCLHDLGDSIYPSVPPPHNRIRRTGYGG